jgi:hypothetical protein
MSVTSRDVIAAYSQNSVRLTPAVKSQLLQESKDRSQEEYTLIRQVDPCISYGSDNPVGIGARSSTGIKQKISANLTSLNMTKLQEFVRHSFFSIGTMKSIACITNIILYGPGSSIDTANGSSLRSFYLHEYFTNLKRFGSASVEGTVFKADFGPSDSKESKVAGQLFVIKACKDCVTGNPSSLQSDFTHELFIGIYGVNQLRATIPNFAYIYGGLQCNLPIMDEKGNVASWCTKPVANKYPYVMYEAIFPSITFGEAIKTCTALEFRNYYLQVLLSLRFANITCGFTHYDAHDENVLLRNPFGGSQGGPGRKVAIYYPFPNPGATVDRSAGHYIITDRISTFIDYGFSYIEYSGESFGTYKHVEYSIDPHQSFVIGDAYKLLMFLSLGAKDSKNAEVLNDCYKLYAFFNTPAGIRPTDPRRVGTTLDQELIDQRRFSYTLPINDVTKKMTIDNFILYFLSVFGTAGCPFITDNPPDDTTLLDTKTFDIQDVIKRISSGNSDPHTAIEFAEYLNNIYIGNPDLTIPPTSGINYSAIKESINKTMSGFYLPTDLSQQEPIDLRKLTDRMYTEDQAKEYLRFSITLVRQLDDLNRMKVYYNGYSDLLTMLNNPIIKAAPPEYLRASRPLPGKGTAKPLSVNTEASGIQDLTDHLKQSQQKLGVMITEESNYFKWITPIIRANNEIIQQMKPGTAGLVDFSSAMLILSL